MNIFGLFFSFFIPGTVVGMLLMSGFYHEEKVRRRNKRLMHQIEMQRKARG